MANPSDYISSLQSYHPDVDLSSVPSIMQSAQQAASAGSDVNQWTGQNAQNPDIVKAYVQKYSNFYAPQNALINANIGVAQQQGQLLNQQNSSQQSQVNQAFGNTGYQIGQNQLDQNQSLFNQADQMGLSKSGVTAASTGRIASNTTQALSYNDAQRANALASLAIQNQQNNLSTQGDINQLHGQLASNQSQISQQATQDAYNNSQNYYNRQLSTLQAISTPNFALLSTSPAYAQAYSQMLSRAGMGSASVQDIMNSAKQYVQKYSSTSSQGAPSSPSGSPVTNKRTPTSYSGESYSPTPPNTPSQAPSLVDTIQKYGYGPNTAGVGSDLFSQALPSVQTIFQGNWQGKDIGKSGFSDSPVYAYLNSKIPGITPSQASFIYYRARKSIIGQ
ncbi:MAG: hypothetical protein NVS1B10_07000 [Candidatus Saccharimonadales bacterium]